MKRHILIIALVASLFCGCKKQWDGDWFNRFSPEYVDMGLEGGEISITAHREIVYVGIYVVDDQGKNIRSISQVENGDPIKIYVTDGYVKAQVQEVLEEKRI